MVLNKLTLFILIFSIQFTYSQKVNWISFEEAVELQKTNPKNIMMDVYTKWCGPCKMVGPIVEEIAIEFSDKIKVGKLDVDANQNSAAQQNVMSIPTLAIFKGGEVVAQQVGALSKTQLTEFIESNL